MAIPKPGTWKLKSVYHWPSYNRSFERKKSGADQLTEAVTGKKKQKPKSSTSLAGKVKSTMNQIGKKASEVLDAKGQIRQRIIDEASGERKEELKRMYARRDAAERRKASKYEKRKRTERSLKSYNKTSKKKDEES